MCDGETTPVNTQILMIRNTRDMGDTRVTGLRRDMVFLDLGDSFSLSWNSSTVGISLALNNYCDKKFFSVGTDCRSNNRSSLPFPTATIPLLFQRHHNV
jgi:hypothetical protein